MRLILMDRWGGQIRTLTDVLSATWTEELGGEDALELKTATPVAKGNRVVWLDAQGLWHEHIVSEVEQAHAEGAPTYRATCENSISELYGDFVEDRKPRDEVAAAALAGILETTRWEVGTVSVKGSASTNFYRVSAREALQKLIETWGGELSTTIEVEGCEVTARRVNLTRRGRDNGRRFTYSRDMTEVSRTFCADDVVTAMYGFGKGEEVGDGYGRGIDFSEINKGKSYVEDLAALELWGRPDGRGGKAHVFGVYENSECADKRQLLEETRAALAERCAPRASYEASVLAYSRYGYDMAGVALGDDIALVDTAMEPEVRVKGRATRIVRDMLDGGRATEVTVGNIVEGLDGVLASQGSELQGLKDRATAWDVAASTPGPYIEQVMDGLNAKFDEGASYVYTSPEMGVVIGSVPLDPETGLPTRLPASALQLAGGGFRIADSLKGDGTWDWRTFGTGAGFTADEIVAGRIKGGSSYWDLESGDMGFSQGTIHSADGSSSWDLTGGSMLLGGDLTISGGRIADAQGDSYWDLTSGDMVLAGDLTVRGGKIMDASGRNVWNLADDLMTVGNPNTIIRAGRIEGAGGSYWDLTTGEMELDFAPSGMVDESDLAAAISSSESKINSRLNSVRSSLESDIEDCQWGVDMARNVTDRISFTSRGMVIEGTNGQSQTVATYNSQGFVVDASMAQINSSNAGVGIKDWGFAYQSKINECQLIVTDGTGGIGRPAFLATAKGVNLYATSDGLYINGRKVLTQ